MNENEKIVVKNSPYSIVIEFKDYGMIGGVYDSFNRTLDIAQNYLAVVYKNWKRIVIIDEGTKKIITVIEPPKKKV